MLRLADRERDRGFVARRCGAGFERCELFEGIGLQFVLIGIHGGDWVCCFCRTAPCSAIMAVGTIRCNACPDLESLGTTARMRGGRAARPSIGHPVIATNSRSELLPVVALLFAATYWGILWWPLRWLADTGIPGLWASLLLIVSASGRGRPRRGRRRARGARRP